MKADVKVVMNGSQVQMRLTPETKEDEKVLMELGAKTQTHYFCSKGFQYLEPSVLFTVWPIPHCSSD